MRIFILGLGVIGCLAAAAQGADTVYVDTVLYAEADTYISKYAPTTNYGSDEMLTFWNEGDSEAMTILLAFPCPLSESQLNVTTADGVLQLDDGNPQTDSSLVWLFCKEKHWDFGSDEYITAYETAPWDEDEVTWDTRPPRLTDTVPDNFSDDGDNSIPTPGWIPCFEDDPDFLAGIDLWLTDQAERIRQGFLALPFYMEISADCNAENSGDFYSSEYQGSGYQGEYAPKLELHYKLIYSAISEEPPDADPELHASVLSGGAARIRLTLPNTVPVSLRVYDAAGTLVETLAEGTLSSGSHDLVWDSPHPGVYFARLLTPERVLMRKLVLLR